MSALRKLGLGAKGDRLIYDYARDCQGEKRYRAIGYFDYENEVFVKRGGGWNADPARMGYGFRKSDVAGARADLRALGILRTSAQTEELLIKALVILDGGNYPRAAANRPKMEPEAQRAAWRMRKARLRAEKIAAGLCSVCCKNPASVRLDGTLGRTCYFCGRAANERARERKAKRAPKQATAPLYG